MSRLLNGDTHTHFIIPLLRIAIIVCLCPEVFDPVNCILEKKKKKGKNENKRSEIAIKKNNYVYEDTLVVQRIEVTNGIAAPNNHEQLFQFISSALPFSSDDTWTQSDNKLRVFFLLAFVFSLLQRSSLYLHTSHRADCKYTRVCVCVCVYGSECAKSVSVAFFMHVLFSG